MLRQLCSKRFPLLAVIIAAAALALPSFASALSWGPVGTTHVLDSSDLEVTFHFTTGPIGVACTGAQLHVDVVSPSDVTVTNLLFPKDCHGTDGGTGCTVTAKATRLHWTMTGSTTTDIQIHGIHIDWLFETAPPPDPTPCPLAGVTITTTGTLRGGIWDHAEHELTFRKPTTTGLTSSGPSSVAPTTISGTFRDTTQSLTLS